MPDVVPGADRDGAVAAALELSRLRECSEDERAVLSRLRREVAAAVHALADQHNAHLVEANERLVIAMLRAQGVAALAAKALEEAVRPAQRDPLTSLPSRTVMLDRILQAIGQARRHGMGLALLFVDVDHFKHVNDSWGHAAGDQALRVVGQRLVSATRTTDTVSRHGGDEFLVLLSEIDRASDAVQIAGAINAAVAVPMSIGARELQLSASIGISFYPDDGDDPQALIDCADTAMYRAKRERLGNAVFDAHALGRPGAAPALTERGAAPALDRAATPPELLNLQMQEANERLILAAIGAQELHALAVGAYRQQQEFLAVVSHELRNPLASIHLASSMLEPRNPSKSTRLHRIIDDEVMRMTRLVGDLLDMSRVATGKMRLDCVLVDLVALVDDAVHGCRVRIDARRQRLDVDTPTDPVTVFADPTRLVQVIVNLLDNASKYTPEAGDIGLRLEASGEFAVLTVIDDGIGIRVDMLPRIFEPFLQDRHASEFNGAGLGIGLTLVRQLVEGHGGTVEATSEGVGRGSRFVVTLPLASSGNAVG